MKAAVASFLFVVASLLLLLVGGKDDSGWPFLFALLAFAALAVGFAAVAVVVAATSRKLDLWRRAVIIVIALPVLIAFGVIVMSILGELGND